MHLPTRLKRWTFLKAPFKYKRAQESWEMRVYGHMVAFEADPETASKFLTYVKSSSLAGVGIKITRTAYSPLDSFYVNPYLKPSTVAPNAAELKNWDISSEIQKVVQAAQ